MSYFATIIASNRSLTSVASRFSKEVFVMFLFIEWIKTDSLFVK